MQLIEAGKIVGTHGVHGEVKIEPWCDEPDFLLRFSDVYINKKPYKVTNSRVHKTLVILKLDNIETPQDAQALRGMELSIDREGISLPEGRYFVQDLIGLSVINHDGARVGVLYEVMTMSAHDVYRVQGDDGEHYIPVVPEFVKEIDIDSGIIHVKLIEGM
ncbi:MAG: ribosome maturation factor RimM [Oscillospiraceae bacterium]|nr:ribosome maturation factor RimM [Oscillospiraceae bacterium]